MRYENSQGDNFTGNKSGTFATTASTRSSGIYARDATEQDWMRDAGA